MSRYYLIYCGCWTAVDDNDCRTLCPNCIVRINNGDDGAVKSATITCVYGMFQAEGQLKDDRWFYFRARHHAARLSVATTQEASFDPRNACTVLQTPTNGRNPLSFISLIDGLTLMSIMLRLHL